MWEIGNEMLDVRTGNRDARNWVCDFGNKKWELRFANAYIQLLIWLLRCGKWDPNEELSKAHG